VDWANDPLVAGAPPISVSTCADANGNPCDFAFAVNAYNGDQTDGDCAFVGLANPASQTVTGIGIGYISDYRYGATSLGPIGMYYFSGPYFNWYGLLSDPTYTAGQFDVTFDLAVVPAPY
jgi:hypothetical protein